MVNDMTCTLNNNQVNNMLSSYTPLGYASSSFYYGACSNQHYNSNTSYPSSCSSQYNQSLVKRSPSDASTSKRKNKDNVKHYNSNCNSRFMQKTKDENKYKKSTIQPSNSHSFVPSCVGSFSPFVISMKSPPCSSSVLVTQKEKNPKVASNYDSQQQFYYIPAKSRRSPNINKQTFTTNRSTVPTTNNSKMTSSMRSFANLTNILNPVLSSSSSVRLSSSSCSSVSSLDDMNDNISNDPASLSANHPTLNYLNPNDFVMLVLDYLHRCFLVYPKLRYSTFQYVQQLLENRPDLLTFISQYLLSQLNMTSACINLFIDAFLEFVTNEDINESEVNEVVLFLQSPFFLQHIMSKHEACSYNILTNLALFVHYLLKSYKEFLVSKWIKEKKIIYSCEFGKKSNVLFLCMECNREHY